MILFFSFFHLSFLYLCSRKKRINMLSAKGITLAYGKRVLFDDVNINFTKGNCYGIIGANGAGKSTFLKILSGEIEANKGTVEVSPGERMSFLKQNQFAYDDQTVLNTVLMGHEKLWAISQEREMLYAKAEMTEEEGMRVGDLETEFGEMGGYTADSDAATFLNELGLERSITKV
jgi:ATPase subunit of ABC transporter with duplicated ATPase domains